MQQEYVKEIFLKRTIVKFYAAYDIMEGNLFFFFSTKMRLYIAVKRENMQ